MARRAKKRRSSRGRSLRRNPLSRNQKLLVLGGVVVVGGVAAYALTSGLGAPPPPPPGPPPVDPGVAKAQECAALEASLAQLRAQPNPDRPTMQQLESRLSVCINEARALNAPVDSALAAQSDGDALLNRIDAWWGEFKATDRIDVLKRGNIRGEMARAGTAMAAAYNTAATAATTDAKLQSIRQSILRALDASMIRRLCYHFAEPQCDRYDLSVEPHHTQKEAEEKATTFVPLLAAHQAVVNKLGGPTSARLLAADNEKLIEILLRACSKEKEQIDRKFAEYKSVSYTAEVERRNNLRVREVRDRARGLVLCLTEAADMAISYRSVPLLRTVATVVLSALNATIDRWACFFTNGSGCGTWGFNEAQPDEKAADEMTYVGLPLMALYVKITKTLPTMIVRVTGMDQAVPAIQPLITARLRVGKTMNDAIGAAFAGHYKATDVSNFVKRTETRVWILATGAALAAWLQGTLDTATGSAKPPARGVPAASPVDLAPLVRPIATVAASALDAAIQRKLCYLHDLPGCGRSGVSEDHGNDKAAQEQARVIAPLILVLKNTALANPASAETVRSLLVGSLIKEIAAEKRFIDGQFGRLKTVDYTDGLQRNNIRGSMIGAGQRMVATIKNAVAAGSKTRAPLQTIARAALEASREREACYRAAAPGCDRWDDAGYGAAAFFSGGLSTVGGREDHLNDKIAQENAQITNPLVALLADKSAAGLGGELGGFMDDGFAGISGYAWLGIGAVALFAVSAYRAAPKTRRNKRRRRTSYRLAA